MFIPICRVKHKVRVMKVPLFLHLSLCRLKECVWWLVLAKSTLQAFKTDLWKLLRKRKISKLNVQDVGKFLRSDCRSEILPLWIQRGRALSRPMVPAGCLQMGTLLTVSSLFHLEGKTVPDWVLPWEKCAEERDKVLGGTWRGALQDFLEDGDIRHFLSRGHALPSCSLPVTLQAQQGWSGFSVRCSGGDCEEGPQRIQLSKFPTEGIARLSSKHSAVLHGADVELAGIFLPWHTGRVTPVLLHSTQLHITLWYVLNSVVWPMLVFLSKYPFMKGKHVLGREKPGWWLWHGAGEVTVQCQRFEVTSAQSQK